MKTKKILFTLLFLLIVLGITGVVYAAEDPTDFSNAKIEIKKDGYADAIVEISEVTVKEDHSYYLFITNDNTEPVLDTTNETKGSVSHFNYNSTDKVLRSLNVTNYVERAEDIYIWVLETYLDENYQKYVTFEVKGYKAEKPEEPKYTDAFSSTFLTTDKAQLVTNFYHNTSNNRKVQIKIGKITDTEILKKIKEQNASGFSDLLSFSKNDAGIYDKVLDANKDSGRIEYNTTSEGNGHEIKLNNLSNDAYYYLYMKPTDENGTYTSPEAITLAQVIVHDDGTWAMFFYGSNDFKWADFGNVPAPTPGGDNTTAPGKIPQTGDIITIVISVVALFGVVAVVTIKKNKNLKGIK